ncbi:DEAD/DEAH box helicase [Thioflexithrix psekupsensis]|uniref:DEAD/DEAH box helicase n=1 Tax=Thioflexithrix psekupsensis TaxID=1570016 RepID=A0A251X6R1_9GAMM|nr:DEAD/DEAH box helicase [Thioflexithrix psekupsensis]OUD13074.1 hypothetical protein TPSD3_10510 [Thioflexithrix psekupsensis]
MFRIKAHGVKHSEKSLSYAQTELLNSTMPIRVCGAPTGSGKTYAFFEAVKQGQLVFFVVPTQALARDIKNTAISVLGNENQVKIWDYEQTKFALEQGEKPWLLREEELKTLKRQGGMIVATLESLAKLILGKDPKFQYSHLDIKTLLWFCDHLVFDEAHTLNERAFGLIYLMMVLVTHLHRENLQGHFLKLSLLSATHSNLFSELLDSQDLPQESFIQFDEQVIEEGFDRALHGDVIVHYCKTPILETIHDYAPELIRQLSPETALLLVYDSMAQFARDESNLAHFFKTQGIRADEVILINGQDKQSSHSFGGTGFEAGLFPAAKHRVIIGTSAVEMGVNFKVNCAIIESGFDAAGLLQRIGRVARGEKEGVVYVCLSSVAKIGDTLRHVKKLEPLANSQESYTIEQVRQKMADKKGHLKVFDLKKAKYLGGAFWSVLSRGEGRYLMKDAVLPAFDSLIAHKTDGKEKLPAPCDFLNYLHQLGQKNDWNGRSYFEAWLAAVDKALCDVRGFTPTLKVSFNGKLFEYNADWVLSRLESADLVDEDGRHIYTGNRSDYLREKAEKINFSVLNPFGSSFTISETHFSNVLNPYLSKLEKLEAKYGKNPVFKSAILFIRLTGLVVRDEQMDSLEKSGGII